MTKKEMNKPVTKGDIYTAMGVISGIILSSAGFVIMGIATEWRAYWGIFIAICGIILMNIILREAEKEE